MGSRRKIVYLTDHCLEKAFIVLAVLILLPSPPETETDPVQITDVKAEKYLQP